MTADAPIPPPIVPQRPAAAPLRLEPNFWTALRGVWLLTWRGNCTMRGLGMSAVALWALPLLAWVSGAPRAHHSDSWSLSAAYYHLVVDFYFFLVLPLVCVRSCGALIRDELQADTLGFLLTRPARRAALVVVKYLSQTAWLMMLLLAQTVLLFCAGAARGVPNLASVLWILLAAQAFAVPVWSALGLLFGLFTNRYIPAALLYGVLVELGIGRIPTNINTLSMMRHLKALLANNQTLRDLFDWTDQAVWLPIAALLVGTALFVALSAALFTFREYHHNAEMQK